MPPSHVPQGLPGFLGTVPRTHASSSQSKRATNCATPGNITFCMIARMEREEKLFLAMGVRMAGGLPVMGRALQSRTRTLYYTYFFPSVKYSKNYGDFSLLMEYNTLY